MCLKILILNKENCPKKGVKYSRETHIHKHIVLQDSTIKYFVIKKFEE